VPGPVPAEDAPELAGYREGLARQVLQVPQCPSCGSLRWPPRSACPACGVVDFAWTPVPAAGTLHSYAVVNRAFHPAFAGEIPYLLCVTEVTAGVRFLGRLIGVAPSDVWLGMPLTAEFVDVSGVRLVYWRAAQPGG
jgi:uncharacterized OB-fold protein